MRIKMRKISDEKLREIDKYILVSGEQFLRFLNRNYELPNWFLHKYRTTMDWDDVCTYQNLNEKFIEEHVDCIDSYSSWGYLCSHQDLSIDFLEKHEANIDWSSLIQNAYTVKELVEKFYSHFSLFEIRQRNLIEEFMTEEELDALEIMHQITK